ncbi:hypothetical protein H257_19543, partial [Aphanomyces astaci]
MGDDGGGSHSGQVDSKLRRRAYMRNMMKIYRDEFKLEMAYLCEREKQLEENLRGILHERRQASMGSVTAPSGQQKTTEYHRILRDMEAWVAHHQSIPSSLNACVSTWRDMTLLEHPPSRDLGKAWITRQMYHNSNRMFHQYQFPSTTSSHDLYDVEVVTCPDTGALEYVHRRQFDIALPASFLLQ